MVPLRLFDLSLKIYPYIIVIAQKLVEKIEKYQFNVVVSVISPFLKTIYLHQLTAIGTIPCFLTSYSQPNLGKLENVYFQLNTTAAHTSSQSMTLVRYICLQDV